MGQVPGPTCLVPVVFIDDITPTLFALNGRLVDVEITGGPQEAGSPIMRARFLRESIDVKPWTVEQFERVYPDFQPLMTFEQFHGFFE
jgi:hypothetical protein